jgi:hypothetical protein
MEHKTLHEIDQVAERLPSGDAFGPMSRQQRLERWATLLEQHEGRPMRPLLRVEFLPEHERALVRADNSPLALAYGDPALRAAGLQSDRYGDALTFFELTDREAHYLLCDCHYHGTMTGSTVAARVRSAVGTLSAMGQFWSRMRGS